MTTSSLDPDNLATSPDRILGKGHGTSALGPSDSSDSGSDVQGTGSTVDTGGTGFERDPTADATFGSDAGLESDTDSRGTGERASVEGVAEDGADIDTDHIETLTGFERQRSLDDHR